LFGKVCFPANRINTHWEYCACKGYAKTKQKPPTVNVKYRLTICLWKTDTKYRFLPETYAIEVLQLFSEVQVACEEAKRDELHFAQLHAHTAPLACLFDAA